MAMRADGDARARDKDLYLKFKIVYYQYPASACRMSRTKNK